MMNWASILLSCALVIGLWMLMMTIRLEGTDSLIKYSQIRHSVSEAWTLLVDDKKIVGRRGCLILISSLCVANLLISPPVQSSSTPPSAI